MSTGKKYSKMLFLVALLVAFVAGCGSDNNDAAPLSSAKAITAFVLNGSTGTIDETAKTISVTVPNGTSVTALVATYVTTGASVKVGTTIQHSGALPSNDFTNTVIYTVVAANGTSVNYAVTVIVAPNTAKSITAYSINGVDGTITEGTNPKTISLTLPFGTPVTALTAEFETSGALVSIGATTQISGSTVNNFTSPKTYTVKAIDGSTADYTVTVTVALNSAKAITAYSFETYSGATGVIDEAAKTIAVTVPYGTDVTTLAATFLTSGSLVTIGSTTQVTGTTVNSFASPKTYTVHAANGSMANYVVTVTIGLNTAKDITSYTIASQLASTITGTAIAVTMPASTPSVTNLIATFTASPDAVVTVLGVTQASGTTENDFTLPVDYLVTAASGTTATYTVTVTVEVSVPTGLDLRRTASFGILAGSSITSTGTTTVTGDVGATSLSGAPLVVLAGTDYSSGVGQAYTDAMTDLPLVIADATDTTLFPCGTNLAANLSSVSLTPGVTCILADAAILSTGITTLDGAGIYMIRTGGALTPAASSSVAYGGTANASNTSVVWVVNGATVGTPSTWIGTILSTAGAVILGDGDTLANGRVLTHAAVTVTNNVITIP